MKKVMQKLALILVIVLLIGTVGCGNKDKKEPNSTSMKVDSNKKEIKKEEKKETAKKPEEKSVLEKGIYDYYANMPKNIYKIDQKEFIEKVKNSEDMFVLDVRQPDVYKKGHIKGAVNAPWGKAISENLSKIPADKPVYVYCYTGQTAGQTVMTLNLAGFNARSVNLGWNLGISKVEGYKDVTETKANEFGDAVTKINPEIQKALDAYYAGLGELVGTTFEDYKVSEDSLKGMIDNNEDFYLLSVRDKKDFDKEHIKGAKNIPWGSGMEKSFSQLPKDKKIVVYCYTGQTAGQTVAGLRLLGYDAVSLNGGLGMKANAPIGWKNKGYEVTK